MNIKNLTENDKKTVLDLCEKYDCTVNELAIYVQSMIAETKCFHLRCSKSEIAKIDENVLAYSMPSRSEYLIMACLDYIRNQKITIEMVEDINKSKKNMNPNEKRENKVNVSFNKIDEYLEIFQASQRLGIKTANFIRYVGINYKK